MEKYKIVILPFLILIFVLVSNNIFAQKKYKKHQKMLDTKHNAYFEDKIEPGSKLLKTRIHYSFEETADGKYIYKQYYPEKHVKTLHVTYKDKKRKVRDGLYQTWFDNGQPSSRGMYKDGDRTGEWQNDYDSGAYEKGNYVLGKRDGEWISYDSTGIKNRLTSYSKGKRDGVFEVYENNVLIKKGIYEDDELVSEEKLLEDEEDNAGVDNVEEAEKNYKVVEKMPHWVDNECTAIIDDLERTQCGNRKMLEFVYKNIQYPAYCVEEEIEGTVVIRFVVNKNGEIEDAVAVKGVCAGMEKECLRIVNMMPDWQAGMQRGKAVKVYFNLPVKFRLN